MSATTLPCRGRCYQSPLAIPVGPSHDRDSKWNLFTDRVRDQVAGTNTVAPRLRSRRCLSVVAPPAAHHNAGSGVRKASGRLRGLTGKAGSREQATRRSWPIARRNPAPRSAGAMNGSPRALSKRNHSSTMSQSSAYTSRSLSPWQRGPMIPGHWSTKHWSSSDHSTVLRSLALSFTAWSLRFSAGLRVLDGSCVVARQTGEAPASATGRLRAVARVRAVALALLASRDER